ncbi:MAG: transcription antitermination factor NusB [Planctomycetes bacterium]|nr:transcription antitermination factor NusB [Planctomycetota bacterium]
MRPRTIGRRLALQYLFMADLNRYQDIESPFSFFATQRAAARDNAGENGESSVVDTFDPKQDEAEQFAFSLIQAVEKDRDAIDARIEKAAKNWTVARMGVIERNVIRLAAAELALGSPRGVVLDEAVELAKRFADNQSGAFVNGIADKLADEHGAPNSRAQE